MSDALRPGPKGASLPDGVFVVRLGKPNFNVSGIPEAHETHFSLSTEDERSELQSLSVWARDLTPAEKARELMGVNRAAYTLALHLDVDNIRAIGVPTDFPQPPLNVVWDPDPRPGAEGHAGIIGLMRPPHGERKKYKALRAKLALIAFAEVLPALSS